MVSKFQVLEIHSKLASISCHLLTNPKLLLAVYGQEVRVRTSQSARRHLKDKGLLPPNTDETPLQDVALNFLLDNPNVSVALLGITREEYLNDAFKILDDRSSK